MEKIKRIFKYVLIGFAALLTVAFLFVLGGAAWVYSNPLRAWQLAEEKFLPPDLKISWNDVQFDWSFEGDWRWRINIFVDGLAVQKASPSLEVHVDELRLVSNFTLFFPKTEFSIESLQVKSESPIRYQAAARLQPAEPFDPAKTLEQVETLIGKLAKWQDRITIEEVNIDLSDLEYLSDSNKVIRGSVKLNKQIQDGQLLSFEISVLGLNPKLSKINAQGSGDLTLFGTAQPFLNATFSFEGEALKSEIPLKLSFFQDQLHAGSDFKFRYKLKSKMLEVRSNLNLTVNSKELDLKLVTDAQGLPGPIPKISNIRLSYQLPFENRTDWLESKGHLDLSAPIPLFFINEKVRKKVNAICKCTIATHLQTSIGADIWLRRLAQASSNHEPAVDGDLRAESYSNSVFSIQLGATFKIFHTSDGWLFEPTVDSTAQIANFKAVKEILQASHILIPAPFSVLDGTVDFSAKSPVTIKSRLGFPAEISAKANLSTNLQSPRQKININSTLLLAGTADFKSLHIQVDALVDDFIIELPPLDPVKGIPKLTLDSRIQMAPPVPKKPSGFKMTFGFRLKTAKNAAIKLLYPLADPFIPITVDYGRMAKNQDGFIQVEPFAIKYLKRTVFVDSIRLNLEETKDSDFPIDASFHVQQTEYKVLIHVSGTTRRPKIELSSEPYLERADIVSVLLFDRVRDRLAGGDSETAGNAQAAMADRAVGLFGLWAFAATPIRSFSYNAVTKVYSATVLLGDGLTAGIGSSLDDYTSFEIRKRLSNRWVIATSWAPSNSSEKSGEVVLQWEQRY